MPGLWDIKIQIQAMCDVFSQVFASKLQQICVISVFGDCIFKICQIVVCISVTSQFQKFSYKIFGGFLVFRTWRRG